MNQRLNIEELTNAESISFRYAKPPKGAPNVVAIVLDDTGFAHLGGFGSDIATPNFDRLGNGGLRFNRFHVTSLCSPTRASFMTGRNHHTVGMGLVADLAFKYPGYHARIPKSAAPLPKILRDAGYSTMAVGKWHLTPRFERSEAGPFTSWPLGMGFEQYYGFLQGDTNQYAPNLVQDNHYIDQPKSVEEGYHLSEDMADQASMMLHRQQQAAPGKPFFLYFALGAMHAPHQVAPEWSDPYKGRYDGGWERWREESFARQVEMGIVPENTILTERPNWVQAWDSLNADERKMMARQQEVFAGFLSHTDAQVGKVLATLEQLGQLDNTIVLLFSDNGASAEGGLQGSSNEHRFTNNLTETVERNMAFYDNWGSSETYSHYAWGWAWAGNTPFKLWKRYSWLGGTRTPLVVHWPAGIKDAGAVRQQFTHVVDLAPTLLDAIGIEQPEEYEGVAQQRVDGASLKDVFASADAPAPRDTQYFEMFGSRSIFHGGYKMTTNHVSDTLTDEAVIEGSRDFAEDRWELYDLSNDFSEGHDVADEHPELIAELEQRWLEEAKANNVLPIDDGVSKRLVKIIFGAWPPPAALTIRPEGGPVTDEVLPFNFNGFSITVDAEFTAEQREGVLAVLGDFNGGWGLFFDGGHLRGTLQRASVTTDIRSAKPVEPGRRKLGLHWTPGEGGKGACFITVDGEVVAAEGTVGSMPIVLQHGGTRMRLGSDVGLPIARDAYAMPATFPGTIDHAVVTGTPEAPEDIGPLLEAALHAD